METLLATAIEMEYVSPYIDDVRTFVEDRRDYINEAPPASDDEPPPPYCIQQVGTIEADFETTWGTLEEEDPPSSDL